MGRADGSARRSKAGANFAGSFGQQAPGDRCAALLPASRGNDCLQYKKRNSCAQTLRRERRLLQKEAYNETDFMECQRLARLRGQGLF